MRARPLASSFVARASLVLLASRICGGPDGSLLGGVRAAQVPGRWGQSSVLLTPEQPTLLVVSGKSFVAGQTLESTPTLQSIITLDLSQSISDLSDPPWITTNGDGPISAYGSALALSSTSALFFGGDATGDPSTAVQSGNDSSWILSYPATTASNWTRPNGGWAGQPMRRELVYSASATNGTVSRGWIFGGMRSDGSGVGLGELWEVQMGVAGSAGVVSGGAWAQWSGTGLAPPPMWDGKAVLVPSPRAGELPSIYLIGGVQSVAGAVSLASMSSIWIFTPDSIIGTGSWSQIAVSSAPEARRGHVAVAVGDGEIWIQGGRSLDGLTVMNDGAVLDTVTRRWSSTAVGPAVWGHSSVTIGETVLMAFGYGLNSPASSTLTVYSPGNDTFLSTYQPNFVIIRNPKAQPSTTLDPSSLPTAVSEGAYPIPPAFSSTPVVEGGTTRWLPVDATLTNPANPAATSPSSSKPSTAPWIAPGGPQGTSLDPSSADPSSPNGAGSGDTKDSSTPPSSKAEVAGAVVGSLLGAVALVAVGLVVVRRRQRRRERGPYASRPPRRRRFEGYGGGGDASGSLMSETGGAGSSEAYTFGSEKALPAVAGRRDEVARPVSSFLAAVGLAGRTPKPQEKGRFAMLEDEESEVWASLNSRSRGKEGWTTFGDEEVEEKDETSSLRGRGGVGVWDGYDFGAGAGKVVSDTVQSGRSFLTGALGGFIPIVSRDDEHEEEHRRLDDFGGGDAGLTPINEEYGDEEESRPSSSIDHTSTEESGSGGTRSAGTHQTASTGPTSSGHLSRSSWSVSRQTSSRTTPTRPLSSPSPSTSLYGSSFSLYSPTPVPSPSPNKRTFSGGISRSSSGHSDLLQRNRSNSSWLWSRLARKPSTARGDEPSATAGERIRDPAPAPRMDMIREGQLGSTPLTTIGDPLDATVDPFADPSPSSSRVNPTELGQLPSLPLTRAQQLAHNRSISSTASSQSRLSDFSQATVTSSVLEERMRGMDVVQRVRTGSSSTVSGGAEVDTTPRMEGGGFGRLPMEGSETGSEESEVVVGEARREFIGSTSPATTRRLLGPRPAPISVSIAKPAAALRSPPPRTAGAGGVWAMVQQFESQSHSLLPRSSSTPSVATKEKEPSSPVKAASARRSTLGGGGGGEDSEKRRSKLNVKHGMARKPVLYVANPDSDE